MIGAKALCSIGYEKALLQDVIAALKAAGVATLIDVRDRPISRRPGFSKRQLAAAIEEAGMRYVHLAALGTPPEGRLAGRRREWDRFWAIVDEKLGRPEAELDLQQAAEIAADGAELPAVLRGRLAGVPPPPDRRDPGGAPWLRGPPPHGSRHGEFP